RRIREIRTIYDETPPRLGLRQSSGALSPRVGWTTGESLSSAPSLSCRKRWRREDYRSPRCFVRRTHRVGSCAAWPKAQLPLGPSQADPLANVLQTPDNLFRFSR